MNNLPLIILTGPTAVGKTALSIKLAKEIGGEIISADSMQVYRHMDIGSAKVKPDQMEGIPHHLIDVLEPEQEFDVYTFLHCAKAAVREIYRRGRIPIVAGGTGFYIQALIYDIDFTDKEDDGTVRRELEQLGEAHGNEYLHQLLAEVDSEAAKQIHANNRKRVIRAIEYFRLTGEPISVHNQKMREKDSPYEVRYYVVNTERRLLYERIDARVEQMLEAGLLEEVKMLKKRGCTKTMVSMQGLGYKELLDYLDGHCTLDEAVSQIKQDTRHFAKRQLTWFKREKNVRWLNLPDFDSDPEQVLAYLKQDLASITGGSINETDTSVSNGVI